MVSPDPSCQSCVESTCCAELAACAPGSLCDKLWKCAFSCKPHDDACQSACFNTYGGGLSALQALSTCSQQGTCGADQLVCIAPVCDSGAEAVGTLCAECISQGCCAETKACIDDPFCFDCLFDPEMPQCGGNAAFNAIMGCLDGWCGPFCY